MSFLVFHSRLRPIEVFGAAGGAQSVHAGARQLDLRAVGDCLAPLLRLDLAKTWQMFLQIRVL